MNKSVVLKNKFYLFISFMFTFFLFVYLLYFLINGQRGLIKYFQLKNQNIIFSKTISELEKENKYYLNRTERLQPNTIDLDYLEEKLRKNAGLLKENELIILFDWSNYLLTKFYKFYIKIYKNLQMKKLTRSDHLKIYSYMLKIRRFEERSSQLYGMGHIGGFCHLYIGQEAVVVGVLMTIKKNDSVVTTYRDHGHMIARGLEPKKIMSELTGRVDGYSSGKGGSMHMFSKKNNFYGGHGIVGAQVPIGTGIAFTHKYNGDKNICRTYIGDGAMNNGQVFEAFNLAALWKLPVLYIIENNKYGMGTAVDRAAAGSDLYKRGEAFGIKGEIVNGMNVYSVIKAAAKAGEYVRSGKGPYILEVQTYRYRGHSMSDPAKYRTKTELEQYKSSDPIAIVKEEIIKKKVASKNELEKLDKEIIEEIKSAANFALESQFPNKEELYTDVYL